MAIGENGGGGASRGGGMQRAYGGGGGSSRKGAGGRTYRQGMQANRSDMQNPDAGMSARDRAKMSKMERRNKRFK